MPASETENIWLAMPGRPTFESDSETQLSAGSRWARPLGNSGCLQLELRVQLKLKVPLDSPGPECLSAASPIHGARPSFGHMDGCDSEWAIPQPPHQGSTIPPRALASETRAGRGGPLQAL